MKIVSQEIRAFTSTMTIIHSEIATTGPIGLRFGVTLIDVNNDAHPIFVVVPDQSLVRDGCIIANDSILDGGEFTWVQGEVNLSCLVEHANRLNQSGWKRIELLSGG